MNPTHHDPTPHDRTPPATEQPGLERNDREISPTGGVRGKPAAEHGMYGLVIEDSEAAQGVTEEQIRGVQPLPGAPATGRGA